MNNISKEKNIKRAKSQLKLLSFIEVPRENLNNDNFDILLKYNHQSHRKLNSYIEPSKQISKKNKIVNVNCPEGSKCPNYIKIMELKREIHKLKHLNEKLTKEAFLYKNGLSQRNRLVEFLMQKVGKDESNYSLKKYNNNKNNSMQKIILESKENKYPHNNNQKFSIAKIKLIHNTSTKNKNSKEKKEEETTINTKLCKRLSTRSEILSSLNLTSFNFKALHSSFRNNSYYQALQNNKNAHNHYKLIDDFTEHFLKYKHKNNSKFSFLSLNKDINTLFSENPYLSILTNITKSDRKFIQSIDEATNDDLISYNDSIAALIKDYKQIMRINFRMQDFIRGSINLVDSVLSRKSLEVLISNTCSLLNCERASVFIYDKVTDMLIVHSGEGLRKAQIKVPKDKGIVGAVFMSGKELKIDDAYTDIRFNKEIDMKTGFKTRGIMCFPLKDKDCDTFGCIQAINKKNKQFDKDDEEIFKFFSQQASAILKNMMNLDENLLQIYYLQILLNYNIDINKTHNLFDLTLKTEEVLLNLFSCIRSQFLVFKEKENQQLFHYIQGNNEVIKCPELGIISVVKKKKEIYGITSIKNSIEFNDLIDLETQDGLLTFPIIYLGKMFGIAQVPYIAKSINCHWPKESEMLIIELFNKCIAEWFINNQNDITDC